MYNRRPFGSLKQNIIFRILGNLKNKFKILIINFKIFSKFLNKFNRNYKKDFTKNLKNFAKNKNKKLTKTKNTQTKTQQQKIMKIANEILLKYEKN